MSARCDAARGKNPDAAWCDEASYVNNEEFRSSLLPLISVRNRVLVLTSTMKMQMGNAFNDILEQKRFGDTRVQVVYMDGGLCTRCRERGVVGQCAHMEHYMPRWITIRERNAIRALLRNDKAAYEAEILNSTANAPFWAAFVAEHVDAMFARHVPLRTDTAHTLVMGIDPSNFGASNYAFVTVALHTPRANRPGKAAYAVVSVRAMPRGDADAADEALIEECEWLLTTYPLARLVIVPEHSSSECSRLAQTLTRCVINQREPFDFDRVLIAYAMHHGREDRLPGLVPTSDLKEAMYLRLNKYVRKGAIGVTPQCADRIETALLRREMHAFYIQRIFSHSRWRIKMNSKHGGNDDTVDALMMAVHTADALSEHVPPVVAHNLVG
ncbi:MAG TPA: hypothetical protein VLD39_05820 [Gammaproteobacteria bacterium]|nr:hypothetical protein [Gammaproteobacteria bacterium]